MKRINRYRFVCNATWRFIYFQLVVETLVFHSVESKDFCLGAFELTRNEAKLQISARPFLGAFERSKWTLKLYYDKNIDDSGVILLMWSVLLAFLKLNQFTCNERLGSTGAWLPRLTCMLGKCSNTQLYLYPFVRISLETGSCWVAKSELLSLSCSNLRSF